MEFISRRDQEGGAASSWTLPFVTWFNYVRRDRRTTRTFRRCFQVSISREEIKSWILSYRQQCLEGAVFATAGRGRDNFFVLFVSFRNWWINIESFNTSMCRNYNENEYIVVSGLQFEAVSEWWVPSRMKLISNWSDKLLTTTIPIGMLIICTFNYFLLPTMQSCLHLITF